MSYNQDLGRVKGDKGTTYIPSITIENGKQYISFTSDDGTPIPSSLQKREFQSLVYKPELDANGNLLFYLTNSTPANLNVGRVKGDTGNSTIGVKVVDAKPEYATLPQAEKDLIDENKGYVYLINTDDVYLDAGVFDTNKEFVYFENKVRFENYYTKSETYNKNEVYNKTEISNQLGTIIEQQNAITTMLGDTDAIIIEDDE